MKIDDIKLTIVILTYNRKKQVLRCIDSCLESKLSYKYEIIVIDNHSTDGTKELIESRYIPNLDYYYLNDNLGAPQGRNIGFSKANGEFVLFLDDDIYFNDQYDIDKILKTKMAHDEIGILTTKIFDILENNFISEIKSKKNDILRDVLSFHGAIHIIKKSDFVNGLYDSKLKFGSEELLLSLQVKDRDLRVVCDDSITIMHEYPRMFNGRKSVALKSAFYTKKSVIPIIFFPIVLLLHYFRCFKHLKLDIREILNTTKFDKELKISSPKIKIRTVVKLVSEYGFIKVF